MRSNLLAVFGLMTFAVGGISYADPPSAAAPVAEDAPSAPPPLPLDAAAAARGMRDYGRYCVWCHGEYGDGRGPSRRHLDPLPRDFTSGTFKCRTTPSGALPTDADIRATLRAGFHGTGMPAWGTLSDLQIEDLVAALKSFSPRWTTEGVPAPIVVPPETANTPDSVERGRQVFAKSQCAQCHGDRGHGDGPAALTVKDDWGASIRVADFTKPKALKCGDSSQRIYTTFMTGINGTPMPSFAQSINTAEAWDLVHYVMSLRR